MEIDTDLEAMREAVTGPMHAVHHINAWDELNALRDDLDATREQVDMLYAMVLRLACALNTVLQVPIAFDTSEV